MNKSLSVLVLSALVLSSCGSMRESRLNPLNWFGSSTSQPVTAEAEVNPLIPRRRASIFRSEQNPAYEGNLIGEVSQLLIERRPGGAILRVTGKTDVQGPFDLRLIKLDSESDAGTLTYEFRAIQTPGPRGSDRSRTYTAALWLSDQEMGSVREIRVKGRTNIRSSRR